MKEGFNMKNLNLYQLMNYKRKNSILKSVTITYNYEKHTRFRIVEVEPYDETGTNALDGTPSNYDKAINTIERALMVLEKRVQRQHNIYRICVFSNKFDNFEFIFDPTTGKEF